MSAGYTANFVLVPSEKLMKGVEKELGTLIMTLKMFNSDLESLAFATEIGDILEVEDDDEDGTKAEVLDDLLQEVYEKFSKLHNIQLNLGYHGSEEGGAYDDVEGVYWWLDEGDIFQLTPQAEKISGEFMRASFVMDG